MELQINERAIKPINTWVQGAQKILSLVRIDNFQNYCFDGGSGQVHWVMFSVAITPAVPAVDATADTPAIPAIPATEIHTPVVDGLIEIPASVIAQWTTDEVIFDYVMAQLNVQEVTNE